MVTIIILMILIIVIATMMNHNIVAIGSKLRDGKTEGA